jgi:hypothetical protein
MDDWEAMKNNEKCKNDGGWRRRFCHHIYEGKRDQKEMAKLLSSHI